jgi:integrase
MQAAVTQKLVTTLRTQAKAGEIPKPIEVRDPDIKGFILRVQPSGTAAYIIQLARAKRLTIGDAAILTPAQARQKAKAALGALAEGRDPRTALKAAETAQVATLGAFIEDHYLPWAKANRKSGDATVARIRACFLAEFGDTPIDRLTPMALERWRLGRLQQGRTVATVNRDLMSLKAALARAVDWELIDRHPLDKIKPGKVDTAGVVRYLSPDERSRLYAALEARDAEARAARDRGNAWRQERGRDLLPPIGSFADHLTPMVVLSLNTGLRRGEVFGLKWTDLDLNRATLVIRGEGAKSGKTRHLPLNDAAVQALRTWHSQCPEGEVLVFPGRTGEKLNNTKRAWAGVLADAGITGFRWHDMRHDFASRLVMCGQDLNTVRELLGHSDLTMTLRYSHLAPQHKADAVAKLVNPA